MADPYAGYENEIYFAGLGGQMPDFPLTYEEFQERARQELDERAYGYVAGGASSEDTIRENRTAFRRWRLVPRHQRDVSERDLRTEILGTRLDAPVMLAPVGVQSIVHDEAELATARAAAGVGVPMVLSTVSSFSMEDVAEALGDTPRWFQLYWPADRDLTRSFVERAAGAGYSAIVVTLDTRMLAWRPRDLTTAYLPFLQGQGLANYVSDPVFQASLDADVEDEQQRQVLRWIQVYSDTSQTWADLRWLRDQTELPLVVKGVLHAADATLALEAGADAIIVSNHGGRQVDGAISSLDALPGVVAEVGGDVPVLLDSGVRTGSDAIKAVALGARAVLLGRPYVWGLAVGGEEGVRHVLRSFLADLDLAMGLMGCASLDDVTSDVLARVE